MPQNLEDENPALLWIVIGAINNSTILLKELSSELNSAIYNPEKTNKLADEIKKNCK